MSDIVDKRTFTLWAAGDAHVGTDLRVGNRTSLADALVQSEQGGDEVEAAQIEWNHQAE